MATYVFANSDGVTLERDYPMGQAPKIGDSIQHEGRKWTRIAACSFDDAGTARKTHQYPFTSESLPRNLPKDICDSDKKGRPIIRSQTHEREVLARTGWARD